MFDVYIVRREHELAHSERAMFASIRTHGLIVTHDDMCYASHALAMDSARQKAAAVVADATDLIVQERESCVIVSRRITNRIFFTQHERVDTFVVVKLKMVGSVVDALGDQASPLPPRSWWQRLWAGD